MLRIVTSAAIVRMKIAENFIMIETTFSLFLLQLFSSVSQIVSASPSVLARDPADAVLGRSCVRFRVRPQMSPKSSAIVGGYWNLL